MSYPINWDLESIFPGGITSPQLQARIQAVAAEIPTVASAIADWDASAPDFAKLSAILTTLEDVENGLSTAGTFANMIQSADTANEQAGVVMNQVQTVATAAAAATTALQKKLVAMSDDDFAVVCRFGLHHHRL